MRYYLIMSAVLFHCNAFAGELNYSGKTTYGDTEVVLSLNNKCVNNISIFLNGVKTESLMNFTLPDKKKICNVDKVDITNDGNILIHYNKKVLKMCGTDEGQIWTYFITSEKESIKDNCANLEGN